MRVIVRDLPSTEPAEEPESPPPYPRAIILPSNQPAEDRDAFIRWLNDTYGGFIRRELLRRGDVLPESAKDLQQRVLLILWENHGKTGAAPDYMEATIHRVIQNVVSNHKREWQAPIERGADADAMVAPGEDPETAAQTAEQKHELVRCLARLSLEEAEAIQAITFEDLTLKEAAAVLDRPATTIASQHASAKEKLGSWMRKSELDSIFGERRRRRW